MNTWRPTGSESMPAARGVFAGVRSACAQAGIQPAALDVVVHGTSVATNALLEGRGARVGLVTTQGFRHVLHVARSRTPGRLRAGSACLCHSRPLRWSTQSKLEAAWTHAAPSSPSSTSGICACDCAS